MLSLLVLASGILAVPRPQSQPIGVVNQWTCHPTFNIMLQLSAQGSEVQCKTRDAEGFHCLPCNEDFEGISYGLLTCGTDHQGKWGILGYGAAGHWCNTEKSTLKQATIPGPQGSTTTPVEASSQTSFGGVSFEFTHTGQSAWDKYYEFACEEGADAIVVRKLITNGYQQGPKFTVNLGDAQNACTINGQPKRLIVRRKSLYTDQYVDITNTLYAEDGVSPYDGMAKTFIDLNGLTFPDVLLNEGYTDIEWFNDQGAEEWKALYKFSCVFPLPNGNTYTSDMSKAPSSTVISNGFKNAPKLRVTQAGQKPPCEVPTFGGETLKGNLRVLRKREGEIDFVDVTSQLRNGDFSPYDGTNAYFIDAQPIFSVSFANGNGPHSAELSWGSLNAGSGMRAQYRFKCAFAIGSNTWETVPIVRGVVSDVNKKPQFILSGSPATAKSNPCVIKDATGTTQQGTIKAYRQDLSTDNSTPVGAEVEVTKRLVTVASNAPYANDSEKIYDNESA